MSRLEQLLRFIEEDPTDPFNIYAVAMEYLKLDSSKATPFFEKLLEKFPTYTPTYYTFGKLLQSEGHFAKAKMVFESGIELTTRKQETKALAELRNALSELEFEMDE